MSAYSGPLKAKPPAKRPPGWSDGQWAFPQRLEDLGNSNGWDQARVAKIAGTKQGTVSRWLAYGSKQPDPLKLKKLEIAGKKPLGWLTRDPAEGIIDGGEGVSTQLAERLLRLGLNDELVALSDEELGVVERFRPEVRKAIMGICHVYDVPLEAAAQIAKEAIDSEPHMLGNPSGNAPFWFQRMAPLAVLRKGSGVFPSLGAIKIQTK